MQISTPIQAPANQKRGWSAYLWKPLLHTLRLAPLFVPLLVFILLLAAPFYSTRLSLALHGQLFAHVTPKENLDIFQFVSSDNLRSRAIVFSQGTAIGWVYQPISGFSHFIPFSTSPNSPYAGALSVGFADYLLVAWSCRWWLLVVQVFLLFFWVRSKKISIPQA